MNIFNRPYQEKCINGYNRIYGYFIERIRIETRTTQLLNKICLFSKGLNNFSNHSIEAAGKKLAHTIILYNIVKRIMVKQGSS